VPSNTTGQSATSEACSRSAGLQIHPKIHRSPPCRYQPPPPLLSKCLTEWLQHWNNSSKQSSSMYTCGTSQVKRPVAVLAQAVGCRQPTAEPSGQMGLTSSRTHWGWTGTGSRVPPNMFDFLQRILTPPLPSEHTNAHCKLEPHSQGPMTGISETLVTCAYTVRLLSFRTDCAGRILRAPSGGHPQKHVGTSLDTLCA